MVDDSGKARLFTGDDAAVALLGLPGFRVIGVLDGQVEQTVWVETAPYVEWCRGCGGRASSKGRPTTELRHLPSATGKPTRVIWKKREWRCVTCRRSWRETNPLIRPRATITEPARAEAARRVGQDGVAVAAVARQFGVGWHLVWDAVESGAGQLFTEQDIATTQTRPCVALGLDEKTWLRSSRAHRRRRRQATVLVDLDRGEVLDVVQERSQTAVSAWLARQTAPWRQGVKVATLDPAAGYRAALADPIHGLCNATLVLDRFHAEQLANRMVADVRRRVQNETLGHRGRKDDPLYMIRKLLAVARERLDIDAAAVLDAALAAGDPFDETRCAWVGKELLRDAYAAAAAGRDAMHRALITFYDWVAQVEVPELTRLAATIDRWQNQLLAYADTAGASNGKVEAINGEIDRLLRTARGFRNFDHFRTRILLKLRVDWHTPPVPRIRGRSPQHPTAAPPSSA